MKKNKNINKSEVPDYIQYLNGKRYIPDNMENLQIKLSNTLHNRASDIANMLDASQKMYSNWVANQKLQSHIDQEDRNRRQRLRNYEFYPKKYWFPDDYNKIEVMPLPTETPKPNPFANYKEPSGPEYLKTYNMTMLSSLNPHNKNFVTEKWLPFFRPLAAFPGHYVGAFKDMHNSPITKNVKKSSSKPKKKIMQKNKYF